MFEGGPLSYALIQNSSDIITILKADGTICFETPSIERLLGYAPEELIGRNAFDLVNPDDRQRVMEVFMTVIGHPAAPLTVAFRFRHRDGSWHVIESTGSNQLDNPDIAGIVINSRDVTEREQIERELEEHRLHLEELVARRTEELSVLNDKLRHSQKMEAVGLLAGGIAHDFNNILATIKGALFMMQKKLGKSDPVRKYADQILSSVNKANDLTQSLLAFSRKRSVTLKPLDLNRIVREAEDLLLRLVGSQVRLEMKLTDRDITVLGEGTQIVQILVNFAANARDAMPNGGRLTICTDVVEIDEAFRKKHGFGAPGRYALLTVSDTGTGIEESIKGKIFEPFFTTKMVGKGSGLGLAIAYGIVKQHNGYIDVECIRQQGTTFKIYLPASVPGRDSAEVHR
jgi:two-component system cell cycle sensor histidine kinase/response regulator CckA